MMRKLLLFGTLLFASYTLTAQGFSNKGKDFWVGYGSHVSMYNNNGTLNAGGGSQDMVLYFTSDVQANVTVNIPATGWTATYTIIPPPLGTGLVETVAIPKSGTNDARLGLEQKYLKKGIHITSDKPIVAYAHIYNGSISGATLLFPTNTLGKEYYSLNYKQNSNAAYSYPYTFVIATEDSTIIETTPSANTQYRSAGVTYRDTLMQGDILNLLGQLLTNTTNSSTGVELTGTKIKSVATATGQCKKIAVFSGSGKIGITCPAGTGGSADNYIQQCFPSTAWGKVYYTVPTKDLPNNYFRVMVKNASTVVRLNGVIQGGIINNTYYDFPLTNQPTKIEADQPIMVAQMITTQGQCSNGSPGDPEMIYLSSIEQTIEKVTLNSTTHAAITKHYINVILKSTGVATFRLDGAVPATTFTPHPQDPTYVYAQFPVSAGVHQLQSDSGFSAIAYGYGSAESYGYNAGTNLRDLYTFVTPINPLNISTQTTACTGNPFYFAVTYPYQPLSLYWDFHGAMGYSNVTVGGPVHDTTYFINSQQVWRYKLPSTYTYSPAGVYPVSVTSETSGSDGCGNYQIRDDSLYVYDPATAVIGHISNGCYVDSVAFFDSTAYPSGSGVYDYQWQWNFGDPASGAANTSVLKNPKHKFSAAGTYTVTLTALSSVGCFTSPASYQITVTDIPSAKFGVSSPICNGLPVTFSDTSQAAAPGVLAKWYWDYGDGIKDTVNNNGNRIHTYSPWGNKIAKLKVETNSGCQSPFFTRNLYVGPIPFVDFNMPAVVCLPYDSAHFIDASTIADASQSGFGYKWYFGDPPSGINDTSLLKNPAHLYPGMGPFSVHLTVTSNVGCVHDTIKVFNTLFAQAHAPFTVNPENCLNDVTSFTSNATGSGSAIIEYHWDFGDASFSTSQNPTHTYATAGTKTIKHWVVTSNGCYSDTTTHTIIINPLPTANFTSTGPFCETGSIQFTDVSIANAGTITGWAWTFGDAGTSTAQSPTHTYAAAGSYTVTLTVTTDKNCVSAVYTTTVVIHPLPVTSFTHAQACLPYGLVNFTNSSTVADATALNYLWNFGDAASGVLNTTTTISPAHYFSTIGPYTVTLTATSAPGCISSANQTVADIYAQAHANFSVNPENCLNDPTVFTSNATGSGSTITEYHWDFGDASFSTLQNPSHTYATAGTKTIKHWVVTDKSCYSDTTTISIVVNPLPVADFSFAAPRCETKIINFTDASVANAGTLASWAWDFGDAGSSTLQSPTHTYATAGTYTVTLTVTTNKGCVSAVKTKTIVIAPQPAPGFINPEVCLSDAFAQFLDTSHIATGNIITWAWNFGDPASGVLNTSNLQNPQHRYNAIGNYTATLTVTSDSGCVATVAQSFTVNGDIPVSNFNPLNPATMCANDSVYIQDAATVNFGNVTKVEIYWDNINNPTVFQTEDNPYPGKIYGHLYPNFQSPLTRTFTIRYRAYSGATCVNDKIKTVVVNAAPKVQFNNVPNICLDAAPYQFTEASEIGAVPGTGVYSGTGITAGGLFNPAATGPGTFTIKYTFTSAVGGCVDSLSKTIPVYAPPVADFSYSALNCEKVAVTFTDASTTPVGTLTTWTWDFGDGTPVVIRNSAAAFTHVFAYWGNFNVTLKVTTSNGCISVQKVLPIAVKPEPHPNFTFPASVCLPNAVVPFNNTSSIADGTENAFTYLWDFGDLSATVTAKNPTHTYSSVGPFAVNLQVTSGNGCINDTTIQLNVIHPQPKANFIINKPSVCIGDNVGFIDLSDGKDGVVNQWRWSFGDGTTDNVQNPTHLYTSTNTFTVSLYSINSHGCNSDTVTKPFDVYPYPVVSAGPDRVVLEGGSIIINATASGNDLLYLWTPATYLNDNRILTPTASNLLDDMTYTFTVTARGGCASSDKVFVKLLRAPLVPNTFTPNGDGINDVWSIEYLETYPNNRVQVFTRTGQQVFESRGYGKPWDGTMNGKPLPFDTYYYVIEPNNGRKPITGYVTLIK